MIFLISIFLAALLIGLCAKPLKQHPVPFYIAALLISLTVFGCKVGGVVFPDWFQTWVWPLFSHGAFATALWAAVMWAGALPNGSRLIHRLIPIRGELSILAAILTLGHNAVYGRTYFRFLFTAPSRLPASQLLAAICSLLMLCIMLPLFVTSFKSVRRKMKGVTWKKLQRLAYGFYALLYIHVLLLTVPYVQAGRSGYWLNLLVYSVVFLGYGLCRVLKALALRSKQMTRLFHWQRFALIGALALSLCLTGAVCSTSQSNAEQADAPEGSVAETVNITSTTEEVSAADSEPTQEQEDASEPSAQEAEEIEEPQQMNSEPVETAAPVKEETPATAETPAAVETPVATKTPSQSPAQSATEPTPETTSETTSEPEPEPELEPEPEPVRIYKNGSFNGTGDGFEGPITVSVTIQDDVITAISVTAASEDEPYFSDAKAVLSRILSSQSVAVDAVSGATCSSNGMIQAAKAALASAKN
jgi:DMSO/TMAO reductase YedYZ heme-binding membrane subunit/uncharacterized protein with FMN-binding domain